jgi:hypothetical protein
MSTDLALKTLCFLRRCASMATKITPKKKKNISKRAVRNQSVASAMLPSTGLKFDIYFFLFELKLQGPACFKPMLDKKKAQS